MTKQLIPLVAILIFSFLVCTKNIAHGGEMLNAHGTLNMVLVSEKGIVVASDSRITKTAADGKTTYEDNIVKIFDVGGVVVTVAGFYAGGVSNAPNIYGSIPGIIGEYSKWFKGTSASYETIANNIIKMVEFNLSLFTNVQATTGRINAGNYDLHLMFTKTENNKLIFNKVILACSIDNHGYLSYKVRNVTNLLSDTGFSYQFGGASIIADDVMINPDKYVSDKYPIISAYANAKKNNTIRFLNTYQLKELGQALISISESNLPTIGGPIHVAVHENGNFKLVMPAGAQPLLHESPFKFNLMNNINGPPQMFEFGISDYVINVFVNSTFYDGLVKAGNGYYFNTNFSNCTVKLENNVFFFGDNNIFSNCSLVIGKQVKVDNTVKTFIDSQKWLHVSYEK